MKYDFREIESKWQKRWEDEKVFEAVDFSEKPKFFSMVEFFSPTLSPFFLPFSSFPLFGGAIFFLSRR